MESNFCVPMVDIVRSSMKELATVLVILLAELLDIMSYVVCVYIYIYPLFLQMKPLVCVRSCMYKH